jgi:hypothetical protein
MANGTIAFDTLSTSGQISGTAKSVDADYLAYGSAKAWGQHNSSAYRGSFNISTFTDNATGDFTHTFTNAMANNDYAGLGMASGNNRSNFYNEANTLTTSLRQLIRAATTDADDTDGVSTAVIGEIA